MKRGTVLAYHIPFLIVFVHSVDRNLIRLAGMQIRNYHTRVRDIFAVVVQVRSYMIMLQADRVRLRRLPFNSQRKVAGYYVEGLRRRQFYKLSMCQRRICRESKSIILKLVESGQAELTLGQNFNSGFIYKETSSLIR